MRGVTGVGRGGAVGARGTTTRSAAGFSLDGLGSGSAATGTTAASATAAVGLSLLAVQENDGRTGRDAAARRRAASILEELQGLQAELLGGRSDPARLARLAALQSGEEGADPGLRKAVRAIALRARIELARRGRDP
jgi:Class II flagellar assembly regulator